MKCPALEDECPDPEACQQSAPCQIVRKYVVSTSTMTIEKTCVVCKKPKSVEVDRGKWNAYVVEKANLNSTSPLRFIQNALPELTDGDRELLISSTCEPCFDEMFGPEE